MNFNNTEMYIDLALIWGISFIVIYTLKFLISLILKKIVEVKESNLAKHFEKSIKILPIPLWLIISAMITLRYFDFQLKYPELYDILRTVLILLVYVFISVFLSRVSNALIDQKISSINDKAKKEYLTYLKTIVSIVLWLIGFGVILFFLGYGSQSILLAGGLIALVISVGYSTLFADIFSSFVIILLAPFKAGDYIIHDDFEGKVKSITLRDTVIRNPDGSDTHVGNTRILAIALQNYGQINYVELEFQINISNSSRILKPDDLKLVNDYIEKKQYFRRKYKTNFIHVSSEGDGNEYKIRLYGGINKIVIYNMANEVLMNIKDVISKEYSGGSVVSVKFTDRERYK